VWTNEASCTITATAEQGVTTCRFVFSRGRELLATEHGLQFALTTCLAHLSNP
jgi:hypothetical protein